MRDPPRALLARAMSAKIDPIMIDCTAIAARKPPTIQIWFIANSPSHEYGVHGVFKDMNDR